MVADERQPNMGATVSERRHRHHRRGAVVRKDVLGERYSPSVGLRR